MFDFCCIDTSCLILFTVLLALLVAECTEENLGLLSTYIVLFGTVLGVIDVTNIACKK